MSRACCGWRRPIRSGTAQQLQTALAVAQGASPALVSVVTSAAAAAAAQCAAADALREATSGKGNADGASTVAALSAAIEQAAQFEALEAEIEAAEALRERWLRRAEATEQLEAVMQEVSARSTLCSQ